MNDDELLSKTFVPQLMCIESRTIHTRKVTRVVRSTIAQMIECILANVRGDKRSEGSVAITRAPDLPGYLYLILQSRDYPGTI